MGVIHIENVDERTMASIARRARISGRSFEDEVKALLAEASHQRQPAEDRARAFRLLQALTPRGTEQTDSTEIIRELRDRGYAGR